MKTESEKGPEYHESEAEVEKEEDENLKDTRLIHSLETEASEQIKTEPAKIKKDSRQHDKVMIVWI